MKSWFQVPIRVQLILIVAIVAVPAAVIIVYSEIQTKNRELEHARVDTQNIVETVASEQKVLAASAQQLLTILAQLPEINQKDADGTNTFLRRILALHPNLLNIFVADRKGAVWASAIPYTQPINISDRRYFRNAIDSGQLSAGEFQIGRISRRPSLNLGYPYRDPASNNIAGVLCVGIELSKYSEVLRLAQMGQGSNLVLLDYKGTVLFSVTNRDNMIGRSFDDGLFAIMRAGPDADTKIVAGRDGDATSRYVSYRKMHLDADTKPYMYAVVSVPRLSIVAEVNRQIAEKMSQLLLVLVAALLVSWVVGEKAIAERIDHLKMASQRLAEGDDGIRVSHLVEGGELGMLGEVFDNMAQQLALRKAVLLQSESDLRKAQELARLGSWKLDPHGTLTWSPEMYKIFEVSDDFDLNTGTFLDLIHPDDRSAMEQWIESCKAGDCNHELVFRTISADGNIKYISGCGEQELDSDGKVVGVSGTAQDITDRKITEKALIEKQLQLEELNQHLEQMVSESVSELRKKDNILIAQSRQAAMGETIGNIAHQWRQPLNALGLIVQELKLTYGLAEFTKESLDAKVDKAMLLINHMSKTIDEFQHFFKPNALKKAFSVNNAVRKTMQLAESYLNKANITVEIVEQHHVEVDGYENEYSQVLLNILNNSKDAFEARNIEGRRIAVTICSEDGRSVVTVADNAGGIPEDVMGRIFDPYFTTKGPQGTGIGLYMARNIIEKHMDGTISVRDVDGGSEFRIEV